MPVFFFVLELRDFLVAVRLLGALARLREVGGSRVFGAHRQMGQQLFEILAPA